MQVLRSLKFGFGFQSGRSNAPEDGIESGIKSGAAVVPVFTYQALAPTNEQVSGTLVSESLRQARNALRERGLAVLAIEEASVGNSANRRLGNWRKARPATVASMTGELATLLAVGVPLLEALDTLTRQYRGRVRTTLLAIKDQVSSGKSLAEAISEHPEFFDELCVNLVEVGENTGKLDHSLECISGFKRRSAEFRDRVFSALLYPAIVLAMCVGVSLFLMTAVVPLLLTNLVEAGKPLPWPTRVLKAGSDFLLQYGFGVAIGLALACGSAAAFARSLFGRRLLDRLLISLPVIGTMVRKQEISRVSQVISTLLASGLDFLKAIDIATRTSKNTLLVDALKAIGDEVRSGKELGTVVAGLEFFPPVVAHVFTIGQKSGRLDSMLQRLAEDYDAEVKSLSQKLSTVIEPMLIVLLAGVVGFILFATLLPILEAGNVL